MHIGPALPGWTPRERPSITSLSVRLARIEPLAERHVADLVAAFDGVDANWTYLPVAPLSDVAVASHFRSLIGSQDPYHLAIIDLATERAVGTFSLMSQNLTSGTIEMGWVTYSPLLQRSAVATEAQFLAMRYVFDGLGYRRYEWKCDSLNAASRRAAQRLGFTFEGIFRNAQVYKGRSRDTAWFSIIDSEWPAVRAGFERWLDPANFDDDGRQLRTLEKCRSESPSAK